MWYDRQTRWSSPVQGCVTWDENPSGWVWVDVQQALLRATEVCSKGLCDCNTKLLVKVFHWCRSRVGATVELTGGSCLPPRECQVYRVYMYDAAKILLWHGVTLQNWPASLNHGKLFRTRSK